ncbi:MAG: LLM class flavin-dependent oxidoreductase [Acidimicrobiales bacterium]
MKVRIGYGPGIGQSNSDGSWYADFVDSLEDLGFDSLWLPERLGGPSSDPLIALAVAAGRTKRLKLGTSVLVLPGRNPVVLAKEMASLDALSGGRFLAAVGLGVADPLEQSAFGVERTERAAMFDESLDLMRKLWSGQVVDHDGEHFHLHGLRLVLRPAQPVLEVWLGGVAPSELRRVGRLADGWLPSFITPEDAAAGRKVVEEVAKESGRSIDQEHFGALVTYTLDGIPDRFRTFLENRKPGIDPESLVATGTSGIRGLLERFVDQGFSKFVLAPVSAAPITRADLELIAKEVLPLQN